VLQHSFWGGAHEHAQVKQPTNDPAAAAAAATTLTSAQTDGSWSCSTASGVGPMDKYKSSSPPITLQQQQQEECQIIILDC
jgi:hypothetical protein